MQESNTTLITQMMYMLKSTKKGGSRSLNPIENIYYYYCSNYCIIKPSVTKDLLLTVQLQVLISALSV